MTRTEYQSYLQSDHWMDLRSKALSRDGYRCVKCGYRKTLQVHHLRYRYSPYASLLEDLMTLCDECHGLVHGITKESAKDKIRVRRMASKVSASPYDDFKLVFPARRSIGLSCWLRSIANRLIVFIRQGKGDTLGVSLTTASARGMGERGSGVKRHHEPVGEEHVLQPNPPHTPPFISIYISISGRM